ncbi:putative tellurite resistance protein B-like protein [Hoeflea marina]|uniref:Putative tellurite resistance protein B-like protein n=1 Tax=Hoeflea marina TaxID=274592 RepID=A0A317PK71_9HYPH|nr:TerB family tellurite resistance protein [Hoeflea marina]PWV98979.1 putative tellurite resistance protein B-like protein [Hoeflea marina]
MTDTPSGSQTWLDKVRGLFDTHSSIETVADDPHLVAELLLLVRMSFADAKVGPDEAAAFTSVCTRLLGLQADELGDILKYIDDFGYETTDAQAADMLAALPVARKRQILEHMAEIARADGDIDDREKALFSATARRLGMA